MANKKIISARFDPELNVLLVLYDDSSKGSIMYNPKKYFGDFNGNNFVGLTVKQAKMKLGVK